ncbi:MAG: hypothetical protein K9K82_10145 [Desulfobacteraceae bacterium]|nr:hypothetical protein [Desulfobacteraceae bacterium]
MRKPRLKKEDILNQVKIAAMAYGLKGMADDLGKPYSTLSNELDHREYAKLGFLTALQIIENSQTSIAPIQSKTAGIMVLDLIEEGFDRVAFQIPDPPRNGKAPQTMRIIAKLSKDFSETTSSLADAVEDEVFTQDEVEQCLKKNRQLIKACLQIDHFLQQQEETAE